MQARRHVQAKEKIGEVMDARGEEMGESDNDHDQGCVSDIADEEEYGKVGKNLDGDQG